MNGVIRESVKEVAQCDTMLELMIYVSADAVDILSCAVLWAPHVVISRLISSQTKLLN